MKLAACLSYEHAVDVAQEAERLGFEFALIPEGYRSDAVSALGALAATTTSIRLASGVMQLPARTPVATALTAATLNSLSQGRFVLGLGVSNPDIADGWYGSQFADPLGRLREYVAIIRLALSGAPVEFHGKHFHLPASTGEPARLMASPHRSDIPIMLASVRKQSLELTGEIADGWIGVFCSPEQVADSVSRIATGRGRSGGDMTGFEIMPCVPIGLGADVEAAAQGLRGYFANFIGMGDPDRSIYHRRAADMGFAAQASRVHDMIHAGDRSAAAAAVPVELIAQTSLLGTPTQIADRMREYASAGVTTLGLTVLDRELPAQLATIRAAAHAAELSA